MAHWGKCDFRNLKEFNEKLNKLTGPDFSAFCEAAAKELAARLLAKVIKRTPVGETIKAFEDVTDSKGKTKRKAVTSHMGGTLRRGWTAKTEQEAEGGGGTDPTAYAQSLPITRQGNLYQIEIVNPVHYASYVEFGHRQTPGRYVPQIGKRLKQGWVKGQFMLTISEDQLRAEAPKLLQAKLAKYLKEVFHDQ